MTNEYRFNNFLQRNPFQYALLTFWIGSYSVLFFFTTLEILFLWLGCFFFPLGLTISSRGSGINLFSIRTAAICSRYLYRDCMSLSTNLNYSATVSLCILRSSCKSRIWIWRSCTSFFPTFFISVVFLLPHLEQAIIFSKPILSLNL